MSAAEKKKRGRRPINQQLPTSIMVAGHKVKVREADIEEYGLCIPETLEIFIRRSDSLEIKQASFFHELLHMSLALGGISYILDDKVEEGIVRCLEHAMWPLLKQTWK